MIASFNVDRSLPSDAPPPQHQDAVPEGIPSPESRPATATTFIKRWSGSPQTAPSELVPPEAGEPRRRALRTAAGPPRRAPAPRLHRGSCRQVSRPSTRERQGQHPPGLAAYIFDGPLLSVRSSRMGQFPSTRLGAVAARPRHVFHAPFRADSGSARDMRSPRLVDSRGLIFGVRLSGWRVVATVAQEGRPPPEEGLRWRNNGTTRGKPGFTAPAARPADTTTDVFTGGPPADGQRRDTQPRTGRRAAARRRAGRRAASACRCSTARGCKLVIKATSAEPSPPLLDQPAVLALDVVRRAGDVQGRRRLRDCPEAGATRRRRQGRRFHDIIEEGRPARNLPRIWAGRGPSPGGYHPTALKLGRAFRWPRRARPNLARAHRTGPL